MTPSSTLLAIEAAVVAVGGAAMAGGPTAAWLWGATSANPVGPVHIVQPDRRRTRQLDGVMVHRPTDLRDLNRSTRQRIPTVNPLRAVLEVAAWSPNDVEAVMEEFIVSRLFAIDGVARLLERHQGKGIPGLSVLRRAHREWALAGRPPDSRLEIRLGTLLRRLPLPAPVFQLPVGPYRLDFAWQPILAALECDGWEGHGRTRRAFEDERERDAWLESRGWVVWRYSWHQIVHRPDWVASTLRARYKSRVAQLRPEVGPVGGAGAG